MKHYNNITVWTWFGIGSSLSLWCIYTITQSQVSTGPFNAALIGMAFGIFSATGAIGLLKKKKWAKKILSICSAILILYSLTYFLMGGVLHRGVLYTLTVSLLTLFAIYSFWGVRAIVK